MKLARISTLVRLALPLAGLFAMLLAGSAGVSWD